MKKSFVLRVVVTFIFLFATPLFAALNILEGGDTDRTEDYYEAWEAADDLMADGAIESLRQYKVLFVPGFFSDAMIDYGTDGPKGKQAFMGYFDEMMDALTELEIEYKRVEIESEAAPWTNAEFIHAEVKAVLAAGKKTIIVAHSKGGIDTLEFLRKAWEANDPVLDAVKGFIPVQSPFWGSPVADWVHKRTFLRSIAFRVLLQMGGTPSSFESLITDTRGAYFYLHRRTLQSILTQIPTLSYATWKKNIKFRWDTLFEWPRNAMEKQGWLNDGLVPVESAIFPWADYIKVPDVDHISPVKQAPFVTLDQGRLIKTLLLMMNDMLNAE